MLKAIRLALAAALLLGIIDVLRAALDASTPVGLFAAVRAMEAAVGLYGAAALLFGPLLGIIVWGIGATVTLDVRGLVSAVRRDRERDRKLAAAVVATAIALVLLVPLVFGYSFFIGEEMRARRNGALSTALVAAALVPLLGLSWPALYQLARRLVMILPPPRLLVVAALGVGGLLLGVAGALATVDWRVIDFGPPLSFLLFLALMGGLAIFSRLAVGRKLAAATSRLSWLFDVGLLAIVLLSLGVTWLRFGDEPRSLQLLGEETMGAKVLFHVARHLADRDHDGYAGRLGGGDCDDHNPNIHPGADEIRGNGIDEDCDGIDAPLVAARVVTTSQKASGFSWKGNLVVITIDTLRADRLNPKVMPHVAAFAKNGVVFTHAYAQAPNTPRSFPSIFTSRYPSRVKWARPLSPFSPLVDSPLNTTFFNRCTRPGSTPPASFHTFISRPRWVCNAASTPGTTTARSPSASPTATSRRRASPSACCKKSSSSRASASSCGPTFPIRTAATWSTPNFLRTPPASTASKKNTTARSRSSTRTSAKSSTS